MKVSDYIFSYLESLGVATVFTLTGGGIMHLVDSLGRSRIEYVCCHHEQAAGIAAQSYAMERDGLGVCLVTTGPGGTNALTAAGAAYMDSTPVLFITGQVKTADFASIRNVRQFGAQENDIVAMARPVTKYAVTVLRAEEIRYHLEKAVFLALHGRRGPVWLDIPLDIQDAQIDPDSLETFQGQETAGKDILAQLQPDEGQINQAAEYTAAALQAASRPLFLVGHGLKASGAQHLFQQIEEKLQIPVVSTWRALDLMDYGDPCFFGSPGLQAARYSNLITQGADLVIVLGSRLDNMITAFNEGHFAFRAKKIIVDIDENEIKKLAMAEVTPVVCDVGYFLEILKGKVNQMDIPDYAGWKGFCKGMKEKYPLLEEPQEVVSDMVDLYKFTMELSGHCKKEDVIVVSSTSRCNTAGHMAFRHKMGQKTISSMGFGSMGFALPSVIGAWFSSGKRRVVMLEGDGSFQLNIQELETIAYHKINVKMFIFQNAGYAAIATMQDRNFEGFHVGSDKASGVSMPDLEKITAAYGIPYFSIRKDEEIGQVVRQVLESDGPVACGLFGSIKFDEIPKCISSLDKNGRRVSAALENPFPFLSEEEMQEIYQGF